MRSCAHALKIRARRNELDGARVVPLLFDMKIRSLFLAGATVLAFSACSRAIAADDDAKTKPAIEAAHAWLKLTDAGEYGRSYEITASPFQSALAREGWIAAADRVRTPLGKLIERELISATYGKTLPGLPDAEHVVIQFSSRFEKKSSAIETITPMLDKDGVWRVSGYYIK